MSPRSPIFLTPNATPTRECPVCHEGLNGATSMTLDGTAPPMDVGDITCCVHCDTVLIVTADGFTLATEDDINELAEPLRTVMLDLAQGHWKGPQ